MCKGYCDGEACNVRDCSWSGMSGMCHYLNDDNREICDKTGNIEEGCTQYEEDCPLKKEG